MPIDEPRPQLFVLPVKETSTRPEHSAAVKARPGQRAFDNLANSNIWPQRLAKRARRPSSRVVVRFPAAETTKGFLQNKAG